MRYALLVVLCGCPAPTGTTAPGAQPTVADVVARLDKTRNELTSFRADTTMDYWLANQRAKGEVLVMGAAGAHVRFAALSPAGGSTMVEMACDGSSFVYVDYQHNCTRTGPCDQRSIAQFFRLELAPDDFLHLAVGTPPVVTNPTGKVTWNGGRGVQQVELTGGDGTEKLSIDTRDKRFDVLDAELVGTDGKARWSVENTDFTDVGGHRVPGKTRFKSPVNNQDLIVDWGEASNRGVNVDIPKDKFTLAAPAGLAACP